MPPNVKPGVGGLSLSRNGETLVVAGGDGKIRFIDLASGELQRTLEGHTNVLYKAVFSPNEKLMASSSRDRTARIWDVATGRELHKLGGYRCSVKAVAFSPDANQLASSGNDGMLKVWDVKTGAELKSLVHINSADIDMSTYALAFSHDGKKIYASNGDGTISEWDVTLGKETKVWKAHDSGSLALVFSPDYRLLASFSESALKLWDTSTWREVKSLTTTTWEDLKGLKGFEGLQGLSSLSRHSGSIAFSHDGKLVAASEMGIDPKQGSYLYVQTYVWNVATGKKLFTLEGHRFDVDAVVFTRDNRFLLTGSVDTNIKFWNMKTGELHRTISLTKSRKNE
ncbi:MAG TPA: WD40 repeat domain-containing protein [Pyrinomonadaceae bacterium]|nr:WD40 repeat domain-containing protein [Pyrinomonadaceae bacterium]